MRKSGKQTIWSIRESPRWDKQDNLSLSLSLSINCPITQKKNPRENFVTNLKGEVFPRSYPLAKSPPSPLCICNPRG